MRPIKFRAWDNHDKVMNFWNVLSFPTHLEGKISFSQIMQFTGLLDKNGKEIYFEDFVEDEVGQIWVVKWNKTEISLLNISTGDIMSMRNNLLIKSNIYENSFNFTPKYTEIPPYPERSNN
jgi:hypothetical protein